VVVDPEQEETRRFRSSLRYRGKAARAELVGERR
jgi:hypothetical protein